MRAVVNGWVYTPDRIIADGAVLMDGPNIIAVGPRQNLSITEDTGLVDAQGGIICPGLVDIHVHGGDGADCTDGTADAVRTVARRLLRAGTTSFWATTLSAPLPQVWQAFDCIAEVMQKPRSDEAMVMGIHSEGNFFAISQRGAHSADLLRMPNEEERAKLYSYVGPLSRLTIAPEREGALRIIEDLSRQGVVVSGGHSDALYGQVCEAMRHGLSHITHLWSGMSTVRRIGPKRHSGMLEAGLVEQGLTGEIIADGYHLPTSLMKMAYRMKGPEKLCIISDAIRASGMGPGVYEGAGDVQMIVDEGAGVAVIPDRTAFAGSISTMLQCMRHAVQVVGISLQEALVMSTLTPARIMGVEDQIGRLAKGNRADLLILDPGTLELGTVVQAGQIVGA